MFISIEGNIGSGKSTLMTKIKEHFKNDERVVFLPEPVDEWSTIKDEHGVTILENYYKDQHRWAFSFQMMAFITRVRQLKDLDPRKVYISERSVFTDREIFAKMLYDCGKISHIDYTIYTKWFDELVGNFGIDRIVYVNTTPEVCEQRIKKRSRTGESTIPFEYLQECDEYHEKWLRDSTKFIINGDVGTPDDWLSFFLNDCYGC